MIYRPDIVSWRKFVSNSNELFVFKRYFHLVSQVYPRWIETPGFLREPFANPMCLRMDMKPGFYFEEFVH